MMLEDTQYKLAVVESKLHKLRHEKEHKITDLEETVCTYISISLLHVYILHWWTVVYCILCWNTLHCFSCAMPPKSINLVESKVYICYRCNAPERLLSIHILSCQYSTHRWYTLQCSLNRGGHLFLLSSTQKNNINFIFSSKTAMSSQTTFSFPLGCISTLL